MKAITLALLISLTGCCTYQKSYKLDNGEPQKKVKKEYKQCLASEFIETIKFWFMLRGN